MKDLTQALYDYRKFHQLSTFVDIRPIEELRFRLFCIRGNYNAEGYSNISSLENFLYEQIHKRTKIDTLYAMISLELIPLEELVEEAEINRLVSESYYLLLKRKDEQHFNKIAQKAINNYPETFKQLKDDTSKNN